MKSKRIISALSAILMFTASAHATTVDVYVDGQLIDTPAYNNNGTTYVPVRAVSENLGASVEWDGQSVFITSGMPSKFMLAGNPNLKTISHRGFCSAAPENTLPAFLAAKLNGFNYVECDISYTADGKIVIIHDSTIDRTSNGSGKVSDMTLDQLRQYDFGSWKSPSYAGTTIPTLEEFLSLCKKIGLMPYIELKDTEVFTVEQLQSIVNIVNRYGMLNNTTFISFSADYLHTLKNYERTLRLGLLVNKITPENAADAASLKTGDNDVFLDACAGYVTYTDICTAIDNALPIEVWTIQTKDQALAIDPYITGATTDIANIEKILKDSVIYVD